MRIVVAVEDLSPQHAPSLRELQAQAALVGSRLAEVAAHHDLVITLGSGLQRTLLGWQAAESRSAHAAQPAELPDLRHELLAGHLLRQELANVLPADKPIASILTTTEVDPRDPAFDEPTAMVGPSYDDLQASHLSEQEHWALRPEGSAWRRAVPLPEPRHILETQPIEWLLTQGCVVICTAGGLPVTYLPGTRTLATAEVVVDSLHATSVLAIDIDADRLVITTDGHPSLPPVPGADPRYHAVHPDDVAGMRALDGSVPAEFQAADAYTRTTGHTTVLGDLAELPRLLAGTTGTQITLSVAPREAATRSATVSALDRRRHT